MKTEETTKILQEWFASWAKDDVEAVMAGLSETVVFDAPQNEYNRAIPYLGKKVGRKAVAEAFEIRSQTVELLSYDLRDFIVEGNKACILSHTKEICKQTKQVFEVEDVQFIVLDEDGKITLWRFYFDPNSEVAAFKGNLDRRLIQAVQSDRLSAVKSLLGIGANINTRDPDSGLTPLMIAVQQANVEMVKVFLDLEADLYMLDNFLGTSVLHQACQAGSVTIISLLVEAGAFVDAVSATGIQQNTLQEALRSKQLNCAEILIEAGANLAYRDASGQTSLDIARDILDSEHPLLKRLRSNTAKSVVPRS